MSVLIFLALSLLLSQNALASLPTHTEAYRSGEFFTRERIATATEIKKYINESVGPCNDFYRFACDKWQVEHPAIDFYSSQHDVIIEKFKLKIKEVLQSPEDSNDNEIDRKVKTFYQSCVKYKKNFNSDDYHQQLLKIIEEFGGMPAVKGDDWDEDNFDWLETIAKISHKYNKDIILALNLKWYKPQNQTVIFIEPQLEMQPYTSLFLNKDFATIHQEFKQAAADILVGDVHLSEKIAAQVAEDIFKLETSLAMGINAAELENEDWTLTTATALTQKYGPKLNIEKLINISLPELLNESIYESDESYQLNLVKVLEAVPKRVLANYIMYELLTDFTIRFNENVTAEDACVEETTQLFPSHLDKMVYSSYNTKASEQDINFIWEELKKTFDDELRSGFYTWILPSTRQKAIEKLHAMKVEVNTHKIYDSVVELGELEILADDYFGNVKRTIERAARRFNEGSYKLEDDEDFSPGFSPLENTVKIPVAYLEPLYLGNSPLAVKFGAIGSLLGQFLLYGFFGDAITIDKNGNENFDQTSLEYWQDGGSVAGFNEIAECFVDRFNEDSYGGFRVRKSIPQVDNMAIEAGMRLAYNSYLRWLETTDKGHLEYLLSVRYLKEQLFFIAYAQTKCEDINPSQVVFFNAADYIPSAVVVNNVLSKYGKFSTAFGCHSDAPMHKDHNNNCNIYPISLADDIKVNFAKH